MLLKPSPLVNKKKGDPEQLLKDWEEYIKVFKEFLAATEVAGVHTNPEVPNSPCATCIKSKNMLRLVGGDEVRTLMLVSCRTQMIGRIHWRKCQMVSGVKLIRQQRGTNSCRNFLRMINALRNGFIK